MAKKIMKWTTIDDSKVRQVWICKNQYCDKKGNLSFIFSPTFYIKNSTPVCTCCGENIVYVRTEILK